jgi:hypothetical protein
MIIRFVDIGGIYGFSFHNNGEKQNVNQTY